MAREAAPRKWRSTSVCVCADHASWDTCNVRGIHGVGSVKVAALWRKMYIRVPASRHYGVHVPSLDVDRPHVADPGQCRKVAKNPTAFVAPHHEWNPIPRPQSANGEEEQNDGVSSKPDSKRHWTIVIWKVEVGRNVTSSQGQRMITTSV